MPPLLRAPLLLGALSLALLTATGCPDDGDWEDPTLTPTGAQTETPTATALGPSETPPPTTSPTEGATPTVLSTPTEIPTATDIPTPTATPNGTPTATPNGTPTATPNGTPTATPNGTPTATPNGTPTATPNATPTPTALPTPTPTAVPTPTPTATPTPTSTPTPTAPTDEDGDGAPLATDCDDDDPTSYPGAPEGPDGADNDCDGAVDENAPPEVLWLSPDAEALVAVDVDTPLSAQITDDNEAPGALLLSLEVDGADSAGGVVVDSSGAATGAVTLGCGPHTLTLAATDGFGATGSADLRVMADGAPVPTLEDPGFSSLESGRRLTLTATAADPCDAPDALLATWSSSVDGYLGDVTPSADGSLSFSTITLSPGPHTLTLTLTDPRGQTGSASLNMTLTPYECTDAVAAYDFEEGAGTASADTSGYGNDLELLNGAGFGEGILGGGLALDGSDDYGQATYDPSLDMDVAVSVEAWVYLESYPTSSGWMGIVSKGQATSVGTNRNYTLYVRSDGLLHWSLSNPAQTGQTACASSAGALSLGAWHHVVALAVPDEGGTKAYFIDGVLDHWETSCGNTSLVPNGDVLTVGMTYEGGRYWDGAMDEVHVFPCELTEGQILERYGSALR